MARPPGLTWHDRIGTDERRSRWWFDCHRKGHPKVSRVFDLKGDAIDFRIVHDVENHSARRLLALLDGVEDAREEPPHGHHG
jgi:hypothetical protein